MGGWCTDPTSIMKNEATSRTSFAASSSFFLAANRVSFAWRRFAFSSADSACVQAEEGKCESVKEREKKTKKKKI